jgi:site-specific DNA recombinase
MHNGQIMKNSIIYTRVSTAEQAELGYSLKAQENLCSDYAKRNNYNILKVFSEKGESAKTTNRTVLKSALAYLKANKRKVDALIIYKMDRLSRNIYDSLTIRLTLKKMEIDIKSVTEPFDDSPFGNFTATLFSSIAQLDNDIRSERTKLGMAQAIKEGRWLWNAPFGYKTIYRDQKSYLEPSEDASTVKKIFRDFLSGKKQFEICIDLKKQGIDISKQHLNSILKNYLYIGKIKTKLSDEIVTGLHKPLIDEISFYKVQDILNPTKKRSYNVKYQDRFPLKKFLKCPICNRNLAGSYSRGRNKRYAYYHCVTKGCTYKPIPVVQAEYLFTQYLKFFEMKKDVIDKIFDDIKTYLEKRQKDNKNAVSKIKKEITFLEEKKKKVEDLVIDGTFDRKTYTAKRDEIEKDLISKKIQLDDYDKTIINPSELVEYGKRFLYNLSSLWQNLDTPRKIQFQDMLFPEGIYLENGKFRTTKISTILRVIEDKNYRQSIMAGEAGFEP